MSQNKIVLTICPQSYQRRSNLLQQNTTNGTDWTASLSHIWFRAAQLQGHPISALATHPCFTEAAPKVELSAGETPLDRSACVKTPVYFLSDTKEATEILSNLDLNQARTDSSAGKALNFL